MSMHRSASHRSGRFVLRLPPALHGALQAAARAGGLSLNEYCVRRLAAGGPGLAADESAAALVAAAADLVGDALVAVVVYGSWARNEATATSDLDVLVVVEPRVALTRSLYRKWDKAPVTWHGRLVDPHFVHPPRGRISGGVWGEVAVDGVVLFERDWRLSADLADIRRSIAAGRLVRRFVHGQPYWTAAA
jgi:predicted nucleotidyltransferase